MAESSTVNCDDIRTRPGSSTQPLSESLGSSSVRLMGGGGERVEESEREEEEEESERIVFRRVVCSAEGGFSPGRFRF